MMAQVLILKIKWMKAALSRRKPPFRKCFEMCDRCIAGSWKHYNLGQNARHYLGLLPGGEHLRVGEWHFRMFHTVSP